MHKIAKHSIDWAFAICAFFSLWFILGLVGSLGGSAVFNLSVAGYSYSGPIYLCLPAMLVGLLAVGGSTFYLILAFQEGRAVSQHDSQSREIASELARDDSGREG